MQNIKHLRLQKGLSQQKLADILHISQQSVYKYENDITSPDIETLINMSNFFETSVDYIIGHTDISHKIEYTTETSLNNDEQTLIDQYRNLTVKQRSLIHSLVESYLPETNTK